MLGLRTVVAGERGTPHEHTPPPTSKRYKRKEHPTMTRRRFTRLMLKLRRLADEHDWRAEELALAGNFAGADQARAAATAYVHASALVELELGRPWWQV